MKNFDSIFDETLVNLTKKETVLTIPHSSQNLILIASQLDKTDLRLLEQAILKKQKIYLITSTALHAKAKDELLMMLSETDQRDFSKYKRFRQIGIGFIILGIVAFVAFFLLNKFKVIQTQDKDIWTFFLPLVVSYLGFVFVEKSDKGLVKQLEIPELFEVMVLKSKWFKHKQKFTILDEKLAFITQGNQHHQFILDSVMINHLASLIVTARKMDSQSRIEDKHLLSWLYES